MIKLIGIWLVVFLIAQAAFGATDDSFDFESYADLPDLERSERIDAALREIFPPGVQLSEVVAGLRKAGAACNWHNQSGELHRYICKHERKLGAFKSQTTTVYILFSLKTCAVTDYKVGTGTKFGFSAGKSVPLAAEKDPAAKCFDNDAEE